jgi:hypothetical protein|tara:strand:+ start:2545 stop:2790 length:246 start_codon:yes stop_codon:yes gene_type:complete
MIHFRILDETLCGAPYTEPSAKAAKDGRLCNDCIQVMWKEQYRRNALLKVKVKVNEDDVMEEHDDSEERGSRLYLMDFKKP